MTLTKDDISGIISPGAVSGVISEQRRINTLLSPVKPLHSHLVDDLTIIPGYRPEAEAFFAEMDEQPNSALKSLINTIFGMLIAGDILPYIDCFQKYNLHTEQASRLNWKTGRFNATNVNSHQWLQFLGYGCDNASHIATGFNPYGLGDVNYIQDNAFLGIDMKGADTAYSGWGTRAALNNYTCAILTRYSSIYQGINDPYGSEAVTGCLNTKRFLDRNGSTTYSYYINKTKYAGRVYSSLPIRDYEFLVGTENYDGAPDANYAMEWQRWFGAGGYLGQTKVELLQDILDYFDDHVFDTYNYGDEMVVNGGFDADSDWGKDAAWTISGGKANYNDSAIQSIYPLVAVPITVGSKHKVEFTVSGLSDGQVAVFTITDQAGGGPLFVTPGSMYCGNQTYKFIGTCIRANTSFRIYGMTTSSGAWSLDDFSIKPVI